MSPRPPLPLGTHGQIHTVQEAPDRFRAKVRYRDRSGRTVQLVKYGQTKTRAERALKSAVAERREEGGSAITAASKLTDLAAVWLLEVDSSERSTSTKEQYSYFVERYVTPTIGQLRIGEATTAVCDRVLREIARDNGPGAAKSAKAVLNGMFSMAVRHSAALVNPIRETRPISRNRTLARSLTVDETTVITDGMRSDDRAVQLDLPDLTDFMLATGVRIGEACATRESVVDLEHGTVEINATVVRLKAQGLSIQERPKSAAGWRVLALPPFAVDMIERRSSELRFRHDSGVVFPSPVAHALRDKSNTAGDLREVLDRLGCVQCGGRGWHPHLTTAKQQANPPTIRVDEAGATWNEPCDAMPPFAWVHSHTFRKTVATRLDEAGWTPRQIADQLGHARPSITQDTYMGRKVVNAAAASVLDR